MDNHNHNLPVCPTCHRPAISVNVRTGECWTCSIPRRKS